MFFGFTFLLILDPSVKIDVNGPSTKQPLIHHPYKFVFTANEEPSQEIIIKW